MGRRIPVIAMLAMLGLGWSEAAHAQAQCGTTYSVVPGDTLSAIAQSALGSTERWLEIYEFGSNPSVLGRNPNLLRVGDRLQMPPCPDSIPTSEPTVTRTTPRPAQGDGFVSTIEILTANDYAPFTDESLPGGGMLTQVVKAAFAASDLPNDIEIDFIDDWGAHLNTLLPKAKYDFGFPWFRPDCSDPSALPESQQIRCDYEWSDPLYTVSIALFAPIDGPSAPQAFSDLHGRRICRPAGYYIFDLAAEGLIDGETITLVRPSSVAGCFTALSAGEVDFVSLNRFTGQRAVAQAGLADLVAPLESLVTVLKLSMVAHRDNADAAYIWMEALNEGLRRLKTSGKMGDITAYHLKHHREAVAELAQP